MMMCLFALSCFAHSHIGSDATAAKIFRPTGVYYKIEYKQYPGNYLFYDRSKGKANFGAIDPVNEADYLWEIRWDINQNTYKFINKGIGKPISMVGTNETIDGVGNWGGTVVSFDQPLDSYRSDMKLYAGTVYLPYNNLSGTLVETTPYDFSEMFLLGGIADQWGGSGVGNDGGSITAINCIKWLDGVAAGDVNKINQGEWQQLADQYHLVITPTDQIVPGYVPAPQEGNYKLSKIVVGDQSVELTFPAVDGACWYLVKITDNKKQTVSKMVLNSISGPVMVLGLAPNSDYEYFIEVQKKEGDPATTRIAHTVAAAYGSFKTSVVLPEFQSVSSDITMTTATITWPAQNGAVTYKIQYDGKEISNLNTTTYSFDDLKQGTEYPYTVLAVDASGTSISKSNGLFETIYATAFLPVDGRYYYIKNKVLPDLVLADNGEGVTCVQTLNTDHSSQTAPGFYQVWRFENINGKNKFAIVTLDDFAIENSATKAFDPNDKSIYYQFEPASEGYVYLRRINHGFPAWLSPHPWIDLSAIVSGDYCEAWGEIKADGRQEFKIVHADPVTALSENVSADRIKTLSQNNQLKIFGMKAGEPYFLYSVDGRLIKSGIAKGSEDNIQLNSGIFVLRTNNKGYKLVVK